MLIAGVQAPLSLVLKVGETAQCGGVMPLKNSSSHSGDEEFLKMMKRPLNLQPD